MPTIPTSRPPFPGNTENEMITPQLRGFITKRHEAFGGFLYNPFLLQPVAFDRSEMQVIDLLNGSRTVADILQQLLPSAGGDAPARTLLQTTFEKLGRIFAVKLNGKTMASTMPTPSPAIDPDPCQPPATGQAWLSAPLSVLWDITYACNLDCRHCLSASGQAHPRELTTHEAEGIIDELARSKVFTITFCGGEPFMRKDLFHLLRYASQRNIGLKLSTNGTLVSDAVIRRLEDLNVFAVQVSLDGTAASHDRLRNRSGAHQQAVAAIRRFVDAGYYTVVAPVVTRLNLQDMDAVIDTAAGLGASAFKPSLFMPAGRGERNMDALALPKQAIRTLMAFLEQKQKVYAGDLQIHIEARYPSTVDPTGAVKGPRTCADHTPVGCSAGNTQLVITATGNVAACPFLYQLDAGGLRQQPLAQLWQTSAVLNRFRTMQQSDLKGKCRECRQVPERCLGGCRAAAYLHSGDFYAEDPLCWAA